MMRGFGIKTLKSTLRWSNQAQEACFRPYQCFLENAIKKDIVHIYISYVEQTSRSEHDSDGRVFCHKAKYAKSSLLLQTMKWL